MTRTVLLCILMFVSTGCASIPFQETVLVPIGSGDPRTLVERFQKNMPASYHLLNTIVIEYAWRKFTGIGFVDIDTRNKQFKVVCLNPMGVKLFELSGDQNKTTTHYAIPALTKNGDVATAIGDDIRRIFFDPVPSSDARIGKGKYKIRFQQPFEPGSMEYVFGGEVPDLIEKNYYGNDGIVWRTSYYEYRDWDGMRFPQGIIFHQYQYGYRLIIRVKEITS